ncbi:MAG TPA: antibiotic biosynthesis monooxygenase family protein [Syntrophales bacterium]|nr:antibiotic biosynthesis monooxygenase family protein [Syntrophales bacterium]
MSIRVFLKRVVPEEREREAVTLITELRSMASTQPGYISGETMRHVAQPEEYLVISTWDSLEDWEAWVANPARSALQGKLDALLGTKTTWEIYHHPKKRFFRADPSDYLVRSAT